MQDEHSFDAGDYHCVAVRSDRPWGNGLRVQVLDRGGLLLKVVHFGCHPELPAYKELQAMGTDQLIDLVARQLQTDDFMNSLKQVREQGLQLYVGFHWLGNDAHRRVQFGPKREEMRLNRHCERSEAIHCAAWTEWIASSLSLLAMTARTDIEPCFITL